MEQTIAFFKDRKKIVCCNSTIQLDGSPGLVVMGEDSCLEGRGFEFQHHKLVRRLFIYLYLLKKLYWLFEKTKIKRKEDVDCPFKNLKNTASLDET